MQRAAFYAFAITSMALPRLGLTGQEAAHRLDAFSVLRFDEIHNTCRAAGRLQDRRYCASKMEDQILAMGKDAIPILISQLTDTRKTREPVYDFWGYTTAGDVAYFILSDLFTDSDEVTNTMPDVELPRTDCATGAETCWREFVKKHGRRFIQREWLAAWNRHKNQIIWDEKARCFRMSKRG